MNAKGMISIGTGIVLLVVAVLGLSLYFYANSIYNTGVNWETTLNAQYQDNQNYLSNYLSGLYEQAGVAKLKSAKLDQILLDAVKGRYEKNGAMQGSALVSAMVEAYPDTKGLDIFDKIMPYIQGQREGYKNIQSKLLDLLRGYDKWRETGLIQHMIIASVFSLPTHHLRAQIGTEAFYGEDALHHMYTIVTTSETQKAYTTGTMEPVDVNK